VRFTPLTAARRSRVIRDSECPDLPAAYCSIVVEYKFGAVPRERARTQDRELRRDHELDLEGGVEDVGWIMAGDGHLLEGRIIVVRNPPPSGHRGRRSATDPRTHPDTMARSCPP
jgi:hypothetical protein